MPARSRSVLLVAVTGLAVATATPCDDRTVVLADVAGSADGVLRVEQNGAETGPFFPVSGWGRAAGVPAGAALPSAPLNTTLAQACISNGTHFIPFFVPPVELRGNLGGLDACPSLPVNTSRSPLVIGGGLPWVGAVRSVPPPRDGGSDLWLAPGPGQSVSVHPELLVPVPTGTRSVAMVVLTFDPSRLQLAPTEITALWRRGWAVDGTTGVVLMLLDTAQSSSGAGTPAASVLDAHGVPLRLVRPLPEPLVFNATEPTGAHTVLTFLNMTVVSAGLSVPGSGGAVADAWARYTRRNDTRPSMRVGVLVPANAPVHHGATSSPEADGVCSTGNLSSRLDANQDGEITLHDCDRPDDLDCNGQFTETDVQYCYLAHCGLPPVACNITRAAAAVVAADPALDRLIDRDYAGYSVSETATCRLHFSITLDGIATRARVRLVTQAAVDSVNPQDQLVADPDSGTVRTNHTRVDGVDWAEFAGRPEVEAQTTFHFYLTGFRGLAVLHAWFLLQPATGMGQVLIALPSDLPEAINIGSGTVVDKQPLLTMTLNDCPVHRTEDPAGDRLRPGDIAGITAGAALGTLAVACGVQRWRTHQRRRRRMRTGALGRAAQEPDAHQYLLALQAAGAHVE
jgi:hypothetical protein